MRALCGLCIALVLAGCEYWQQLLPNIIDDETEPSPVISDETAVGQHGQRSIALPGGRVLHGDPVLRILDVRNPRRPHVEGRLDTPVFQGVLFRIGNHVIYQTGPTNDRYRGEREDVALLQPRNALLNVDITDRAHPKLINQIPVRGLRLHAVQTEKAIFMIEPAASASDAYTSQLSRYELQGGQLVQTGVLDLTGSVMKLEANVDRLIVAMSGEERSRVTVVDGAAAELRVEYEASIPAEIDPYRDALTIDGNKLRVLYQGPDLPAIDTFDLTKAATIGRSGRCEPEPSEFSTYLASPLFSTRDHALFASNSDGELCQFPFDATGKCPNKRCFGSQTVSYTQQLPAAQRLLALGPDVISLYDTALSASPPLLGSSYIFDTYNNYEEQAAKPIQVFNLEEPATAADGTPEPLLVGLMYYGYDLPAYFELLSASDRTLSPRSMITEQAFPENFALYGSTLVTLSSMRLRTFDIHDLEAPRELGGLDINAQYGVMGRFGDYIARTRIGAAIGGWEPTEPEREVQVVRIDATDAPPVATWPMGHHSWFKAEDLLLAVEASFPNTERDVIRFSVDVYDLRDPAEPRPTGNHIVELHARDFIGNDLKFGTFSYRAVGSSLVAAVGPQFIRQRTRTCSKSIDYAKCPQGDPSGCKPDYWGGRFTCKTIDDGAESCWTEWLYHCVGTLCENKTTYPPDAMINVNYCTDTEDIEQGPKSTLAVIDFRDPDRPTLVQPHFELPGANFFGSRYDLVDGTNYYSIPQQDGSLNATRISFLDPRNPTVSGPHPIPGTIEAVTQTDVYTVGYSDLDGVTLSRIPWADSVSQPTAAHSWPDRYLVSIHADGSPYVYVTLAPMSSERSESDPHSHWTRLEILDAQTLATLSVLAIDVRARIVDFSDGRLLIDIENQLLFVDVRDPAQPTAQAALPYTSSTPILLDDGKIYVVRGSETRSYPSDFHNLIP